MVCAYLLDLVYDRLPDARSCLRIFAGYHQFGYLGFLQDGLESWYEFVDDFLTYCSGLSPIDVAERDDPPLLPVTSGISPQ